MDTKLYSKKMFVNMYDCNRQKLDYLEFKVNCKRQIAFLKLNKQISMDKK